MKIHTYEVSEETIKKMEERMRSGRFTCWQLTYFAHDACGVPYETQHSKKPHWKAGCADRLADRLIQWHRKRGHIIRIDQEWLWNA